MNETTETGIGDEESLEGFEVEGSTPGAGGSVRTFFVFVDLPQHLEFRVGEMPILNKGTEIELNMSLRNPRNPSKVRRITGVHNVVRRLLKYVAGSGSRGGLSQYLELAPGPVPR